MRKKLILLAVVVASLIATNGFIRRDAISDREAKELEVRLEKTLDVLNVNSGDDVKYKGRISDSDELNSGCLKFISGSYIICYDNEFKEVRRISNDDTGYTPEISITKDEAYKLCREAFETLKSRDIELVDDVLISEIDYGDYYGLSFTLVADGVNIPAATVFYAMDGSLYDAVCYKSNDLDAVRKAKGGISEEKAVELAIDSAKKLLAFKCCNTKFPELNESAVTSVSKTYVSSKDMVYWRVEILFDSSELGFEVYFDIRVDEQTGEDIININNMV